MTYPIIGQVTTIELEMWSQDGTITPLPSRTYNVIQIVPHFGASGQPAYITDQILDDAGEHLVIVNDLVKSYQPAQNI